MDGEVQSGPRQYRSKKNKRLKESALTTHNIISMTRYKGLHLLNHHLMKQGSDHRPGLVQKIVPFIFQNAWYKQADASCKTWRTGNTKVQLNPHIVMQDCAVVAVYVTYAVGLWLVNAAPEDWQAWNNLMLRWHKQCLNTNKPKRASKESSTSSKTIKKRSKNPNTTGQRLMHETCDVPNDAKKPIKDVRLTPEELSCQFVIYLLEELWFPVIAVLETIRRLPILYGAPGAKDEPKHDFKKSKHQWAEQIVIARLLSHLITLRNDVNYQDGVDIGAPTPTPLHVIMKLLSDLLYAKSITVYLPDLLGPGVERLAGNEYYHPHGSLRIEQFRIQFAPTPEQVANFNNLSMVTCSKSTNEDAAGYKKRTPGPLTFPEILMHCKHFAKESTASIWTHILQFKSPVVKPPENKRKRKMNDDERDDDDEDRDENESDNDSKSGNEKNANKASAKSKQQNQPKIVPPTAVVIASENTFRALSDVHSGLQREDNGNNIYFETLAKAFGSTRSLAEVREYLGTILETNEAKLKAQKKPDDKQNNNHSSSNSTSSDDATSSNENEAKLDSDNSE